VLRVIERTHLELNQEFDHAQQNYHLEGMGVGVGEGGYLFFAHTATPTPSKCFLRTDIGLVVDLKHEGSKEAVSNNESVLGKE
jgi:hypothetical protein